MPISVNDQIRQLSHKYVRHGGKRNRRQQVRRLTSACDWIAKNHGINRIEQIGKRQVIDFYRNHRHLAQGTIMGYYYAFRELWEWLGRPGIPPEPQHAGDVLCDTSQP